MARALAVWLAASLIGVALMAWLPESLLGDGPLFRFNERHGPGRADGLGLAFILGGWFYFIHALWRRRRSLLPRGLAIGFVLVALATLIGCLAFLFAGLDAPAYLSAGAALAAQIGLAALTRCKSSPHSE